MDKQNMFQTTNQLGFYNHPRIGVPNLNCYAFRDQILCKEFLRQSPDVHSVHGCIFV